MNNGAKRLTASDWIVAAAVLAVGIGLLVRSETVAQGIQNGLKICAGVLIPALFPFMALANFLSLTSAARILSIPLAPITTKVFKLPKELGAVVLLSLVGGYPAGAKSISLLLAQKKITRQTAERMLCICVNSGPSFLISAVGAGMLFSRTAGIILFATQTFATLMIGAAVSLRKKVPVLQNARAELSGAPAFVAAVAGASSAMIGMCAFTVLFAGVLSLVASGGLIGTITKLLPVGGEIVAAAVNGFFEVTAGCLAASRLGADKAFALISMAVSFGGLSVLFQIMGFFRDNPVSFRPLLLARLLHMVVSTTTAVPLYRMFCLTAGALADASRPVIVNTGMRSLFVAGCLLCMCAILTLTYSRR